MSDRDVRDAARRGVLDLATLRRSCGAGGDCGRCRAELRRLLREVRATARDDPR
ncbi:MAG: (2Fe-2S)-binding protein [Phycisphaeraceae bacterium]|nr:(2Fe-2S)-binding protein [Myxococcales bacterium]MCB9844355.1 (2Fe-2S)-binding protein [Phycisphaeraceae bacterium]